MSTTEKFYDPQESSIPFRSSAAVRPIFHRTDGRIEVPVVLKLNS